METAQSIPMFCNQYMISFWQQLDIYTHEIVIIVASFKKIINGKSLIFGPNVIKDWLNIEKYFSNMLHLLTHITKRASVKNTHIHWHTMFLHNINLFFSKAHCYWRCMYGHTQSENTSAQTPALIQVKSNMQT